VGLILYNVSQSNEQYMAVS